MTTPKRFEFKPTPQGRSWQETRRQLSVYEHQLRLYEGGLMREIKQQLPDPLPVGDYTLADVDCTMTWWRKFNGEPVLVNKLRGRANQTLFSLNDLIHPETLAAMTPQSPGCGCVR